MLSRRKFLQRGSLMGMAAATAPLWSNAFASKAFSQMASGYKAVVVISMYGGNDANNMVIPCDNSYWAYHSCRGQVAVPIFNLYAMGNTGYAMHYALPRTAQLFAAGRASVVANVGPLAQPLTKAQALADPSMLPANMYSHAAGIVQWASSSAAATPSTGWGGRMADLLTSQSGSLPPVLDVGPSNLFTVGSSVQAITVQAAGAATSLPSGMNARILQIAESESNSPNYLVAQAAKLRAQTMVDQVLVEQAINFGTLKTQFSTSTFGLTMQTIAKLIQGRSVTGASKQIFYAQQGNYDTHQLQLDTQAANYADFDSGIGSFFDALDELGLSNQVLVCTHSDFGRTYAANTTAGTDHAWGNHQLIFGGGIHGGRIIGSMPDPELGGNSDIGTLGVWIPSTSVTQMTASIGSWMGLNTSQLSEVFPDLAHFPSGAISLA